MKRRRTLREGLLSRLAIDPSGCVLWTGPLGRDGYAYIRVNGHYTNRHCASIAHLEPVTPIENILRSNGVTAINAAKTHCDKRHEFTEANTYRYRSSRGRVHRYCRICRNAASAKSRSRRAA